MKSRRFGSAASSSLLSAQGQCSDTRCSAGPKPSFVAMRALRPKGLGAPWWRVVIELIGAQQTQRPKSARQSSRAVGSDELSVMRGAQEPIRGLMEDVYR
jgi:hypothetical protein